MGWRLLRGLIVLAVALVGCRGPDYLEVSGGYGWMDGGNISGKIGNQSYGFDAQGSSQSVSLTLGWRLTDPNQSVLDRLDAYQQAFLDRQPSGD